MLDALHNEKAEEGLFKAKILSLSAALSALIELLRSEKITHLIRMPFLRVPEYWDALVYRFVTPNIAGVPLNDLTIRLDSSIVMVAGSWVYSPAAVLPFSTTLSSARFWLPITSTPVDPLVAVRS